MTIKIEAGRKEGKNETEQKPSKTAEGGEKELVDWWKGEGESAGIAKRGGERENVESNRRSTAHTRQSPLPSFRREIPSISVSSLKKKKKWFQKKEKLEIEKKDRKRALFYFLSGKNTIFDSTSSFKNILSSFRRLLSTTTTVERDTHI